ncbi:MAG: flavin prenyltransferase [Tepidanaerobacteraceae bacterium]|uniref:Flavin prenyltransferase UbiX n=1 Tax=Fervidicola ferrireducens TaxID=520764 RepID=A0A140LBY5_9FIRM|nr:flavin prenyltransferase UbiX [Fervidicola ferrireducens]KXG78060.1 Phenolic acid decarboxylase subunit B [Fervidicola ferrireducens]MDN5331476.1 flavin prenyltransferase [Tepidanaerobacteraceae bacterium]
MARYVVGITGASGSIYGVRLIEELLKAKNEVHLLITENGGKVLKHELGFDMEGLVSHFGKYERLGGVIKKYDIHDLFAPIASGSFQADGMVIIPCSMSTLAFIAGGMSHNLLQRAADVFLKEKRKIVIVPRETPLNSIHLENMLKLSRMGVHIVPAMPAFYHNPKTIDDMVNFIVGRVLDALNLPNQLYERWKGV